MRSLAIVQHILSHSTCMTIHQEDQATWAEHITEYKHAI